MKGARDKDRKKNTNRANVSNGRCLCTRLVQRMTKLLGPSLNAGRKTTTMPCFNLTKTIETVISVNVSNSIRLLINGEISNTYKTLIVTLILIV